MPPTLPLKLTLDRLAQRIYHALPPKPGPAALATAIRDGMLPRATLVHGQVYAGHCRNAGQARWDAHRRVFIHARTKFGTTFEETIEHPEDDRGSDVFVPVGAVAKE